MPSSVLVSGIDLVLSTSATSRSTSCSSLSVVRLAARIWRCASARTCQICQVERCSSIAREHPIGRRSDPIRVDDRADLVRGVKGGMHHGIHRLRSAENLGGLIAPTRSAALTNCGVRAWRCASPTSPAAPDAASPPESVAGRGRAEIAGPVPRAGLSMLARRADQRRFRAGSTPTISRIGRSRGSPSARSANRTPRRVAEMMFQGGVVGLRRRHRRLEQHPSVDGQPPSVEGLHLVRNGDVSMQIRIPGSGVAVGERGRDQAAYVDLPNPVPALPGEQSVAFDEAQRILHRSLMRPLNLRRDVRVGDRPQRRHRLDRGEGQVIAGNRLRPRT